MDNSSLAELPKDTHAAPATSPKGPDFLALPGTILASVAAIASFHLAYGHKSLSFLILVYLASLFYLARVKTTRIAFYLGMVIGLATFAPPLSFFSAIFGQAALALWLMLSLSTAGFLLTARSCAGLFGPRASAALIPLIYTGWEYFRGELNPLRFTWLSAGFALTESPSPLGLNWLGLYGIAFAMLCVIAVAWTLPRRFGIPLGIAVLLAAAVAVNLPAKPYSAPASPPSGPFVVGIQLEDPSPSELQTALDQAVAKYPQADIIALSEYTFIGSIPKSVRNWCKDNRRYLVAGGVEGSIENPGEFDDTAYVVGPAGEIVFSQCKSVPIPFFSDGRAARQRRVWDSPWGKIGVCVCYDLSYRRVTDDFISQGAGAIICPVMDRVTWTRQEHELHAKVGPMRALEYGVSVFRACSSGISQLVMPDGSVRASAPFPGRGEMVAGELPIRSSGWIPIDRLLGPIATAATGLLVLGMLIHRLRNRAAKPSGRRRARQTVA